MRGASCWLLAATFSLFFSNSASAIFNVTADGYEFFNDLNVNNPMVLSYPVTIVRAIGGFSYHQQSISETGGSRVMRKTGTGALFLSGHDNTYSGGTIISQGALNWDRDRAFGIAGTGVTIDDRAVLGWENVSFATSRPFTLSGGSAILRAGAGVTGIVNGTISGAGALVAGSAGYSGTIVLGGNNSYQGGTFANVGTLQISLDSNLGQAGTGVTVNDAVLEANGTFTTARLVTLNSANSRIGVTSSGQTLTLSGVVGGTGGLNKTGGGALVLTNTNSYQGGTTVTTGNLRVSSDANLGDVAGGVTLNFGTLATTASFDTNRTFTLLTGSGGIIPGAGTTLTLTGSVTGVGTLNHIGLGTLVLAGTTNYSGGTLINGGTLEVRDGSTLSTGNVGNLGALVFNYANAATIGNLIGGGGSLTKTGAGTLTLAASNNYTGVTTVNAGTLVVGNAAALGTSAGGTTVNSGATLLITGSSSTLVLADALTISGTGNSGIGAIRVEPNANPGFQAVNLAGGITLAADTTISAADRMLLRFTGSGIGLGSSTLTFNSEGTGNSNTQVNSAISGTGGLSKDGAGLLALNAANTFTGEVRLNDGSTVLSGGSALADSVAVIVATAAILDVNAGETIGSLAGTGRVILRDGVTLTTGSDNTSTTFAGTSPNGIVGTGNLTKVGTGTFTLAGTNSYSGGTTVAAGTLLVTGSLTSLLTVNDTGTAGGSGTLGGGVVVNAGGRLAPGLSATTSILSAAAVTLTSGSTYQARLNGTTAGTGYDQLQATGNVALGGATLNVTGSITPPAGTPFTLIQTTGTLSGTFQGLANGATLTVGPTLYRIAYTTTTVTLTPIIANLTRLQADAAFDLFAATGQPPGSGTFSGPGVSGGIFNPGGAVGVNTITFTPNTGNPVTFTLTVTESPSLVVTTTSDAVNNTDGQTSLREALAYVQTLSGPQTITFSDGTGGTVNFTDAVPDTITLTGGQLTLASNVTLQGPGARKLAVSGNNASRVFRVDAGATVRISGLTVTGGTVGSGTRGGGILNNGTLVVLDCAITGNTNTGAALGGGLSSGDFSTTGAMTTVVNSTFSGNSANSGGGAYVGFNNSLTVINCTFSGNSAAPSSGGAVSSDGTTSIFNSTISGNTAAFGAGGVFAGATLTLGNCIVAGNTATRGQPDLLHRDAGIVTSNGGNLIGNGQDTLNDVTWAATDLTGTTAAPLDPRVGGLANNGGPTDTMALLAGSPAINNGLAANLPADTYDLDGDLDTTEPIPFDQRGPGFPRVVVPRIDIGAFESPNAPPVNSMPLAQTTQEDTALVFSTANGNALSVADDSASITTVVSITAGTGTLTATTGGGATITTNGTASVSIQGSVTQVNAALEGLRYLPTADANGAAYTSLSLATTDDGTLSDSDTVAITVTAVNDAPSFVKGTDITVLEDAGPQTVANWATSLAAGPANESTQTLTFQVSADTPDLFSTVPAIAPNGTLTFTPAANANGQTTVTVTVRDNGGTTNGGIDTSPPQTFTITLTPVNDTPSFVKGTNVTVLEDAGPQTVSNWATSLSTGPANESTQTLTFQVSADTPDLFSTAPAIAPNGTLTFTPAANAFGQTTVTVTVRDNGGTTNGGIDTSPPQTFTITLTPVNDAPSFVKGANVTVLEDAGPQTVANWATSLSAGPANESAQTLTFQVSADTPALFSTVPAIAPNGTLTFTPAANAFGQITVTVTVRDNGGTTNGGIDTSPPQTFTITLTPVNDTPSFVKGTNLTVLEDAGPQTVANWATSLSAGPANESTQTLTFQVSADTPALFSTAPAIAPNGTLTFTPALDARGQTSVTVRIRDNGGTTNGGIDTSPPQTFVLTIEERPSLIVTTTSDQADRFDGETSLREALLFANSNADPSAVTFDPVVFASKQTLVTTGALSVASDLSITAPAAGVILAHSTTTSYTLVVSSGTAQLQGLTIQGTGATGNSGAVSNSGTLTVRNCLFLNSQTGVFNAGRLTLQNSTLSGHSTGLHHGGESLTVQSCTLTGNTTHGILNSGTGGATVRGSLVVGNSSNLSGSIDATGPNLTTGSAADAGLAALADNGGPTLTHALLPGSPAIDAGDPAFDPNAFTPPLTTDQRGPGFPRVLRARGGSVNGRIDLGAFEAPVPLLEVLGNAQVLTNGQTTPATADHTDFGPVPFASTDTLTRVFTLRAAVTGPLTLVNATLSGPHANDFEVTRQSGGALAAGDTTTLEIRFRPGGYGARSALVTLGGLDADHPPFTFAIGGFGDNSAPTGITLDPPILLDSSLPGMEVGQFTVTDADTGDTHQLALVPGDGDTDNAAFRLDGRRLLLNNPISIATQNRYSLRLRATDDGDPSKSVEVVFELPVIVLQPEQSVSGPLTLNRETGLFEQMLRVTNPGLVTLAGVRVTVMNLPPTLQLWNRTHPVLPILEDSTPLGPREERDVLIQFYSPLRRLPPGWTPIYRVETIYNGIPALAGDASGQYAALIDRSTVVHLSRVPNLGGRVTLSVSRGGIASGVVREGAVRRPFRSRLTVDTTLPHLPALRTPLFRDGQLLELVFLPDQNQVRGRLLPASASISIALSPPVRVEAPISGWRRIWNARTQPATSYLARHHLALENEDLSQGPQGFGYLVASVPHRNGRCVLSGRLPDGQVITSTTFVGPQGQVPLYSPLYRNAGSCRGWLTLTPGSTAPLNNTAQGSLDWLKPATPSGPGFGPLDLRAEGGAWQRPTPGALLMNLTPSAPGTANALVELSLGPVLVNQAVRVGSPSRTTLLSALTVLAPNPSALALSAVSSRTGLWGGTLNGGRIDGLIVPTRSNGTLGFGFYLHRNGTGRAELLPSK